jgi:hypothetical protein
MYELHIQPKTDVNMFIMAQQLTSKLERVKPINGNGFVIVFLTLTP